MQNEAPIGAATALSLSGGFLIFIRGKRIYEKASCGDAGCLRIICL